MNRNWWGLQQRKHSPCPTQPPGAQRTATTQRGHPYGPTVQAQKSRCLHKILWVWNSGSGPWNTTQVHKMLAWASWDGGLQPASSQALSRTNTGKPHFFGRLQVKAAWFKTVLIQGSGDPICNWAHPTSFKIMPFLIGVFPPYLENCTIWNFRHKMSPY